MMSKNIKKWSKVNAILIIATIILITIKPNLFFTLDHKMNIFEMFIVLSMISSLIFFLFIFLMSFIKIRKMPVCQGLAIFYLLGAGLSIVFMMIIKVMSDELFHQGQSGLTSIWEQGEFYILLASFVFIAGLQLIMGLVPKK